MNKLAEGTILENVLHSIWLQKLPYKVQATLVAQSKILL